MCLSLDFYLTREYYGSHFENKACYKSEHLTMNFVITLKIYPDFHFNAAMLLFTCVLDISLKFYTYKFH